jgi:multidrug efflux system membrane fusion protein
MVSINTISPFYVKFSVSEQHLVALRNDADANNLPITIKISSWEEVKDGKIVFIDNMIDTTTGTIKLKALLSNVEEMLWPGQFVKIFLNVRNKKYALIVTKKAVQIKQEG